MTVTLLCPKIGNDKTILFSTENVKKVHSRPKISEFEKRCGKIVTNISEGRGNPTVLSQALKLCLSKHFGIPSMGCVKYLDIEKELIPFVCMEGVFDL